MHHSEGNFLGRGTAPLPLERGTPPPQTPPPLVCDTHSTCPQTEICQWLPNSTRRMAIANGTCVSFCNQPKAHYLATSRESRRYVVAFSRFAGAGIWPRQDNLRHISASPGYAPGKIAVNVTWMERGFNAGQTHHSMYPSISNRSRAAITR